MLAHNYLQLRGNMHQIQEGVLLIWITGRAQPGLAAEVGRRSAAMLRSAAVSFVHQRQASLGPSPAPLQRSRHARHPLCQHSS